MDHLRWGVVALVVTIHAAVTYSGIGSWYYIEPAAAGMGTRLFFLVYETHLQAFFMGLLFFVAGYFVPGAYDRKGARKFLWERFRRLGMPTAFYVFIIQPALFYTVRFHQGEALPPLWDQYSDYLLGLGFLSGTGPMWFALALLIFTAVYTLFRSVRGSPTRQPPGNGLPTKQATGTVPHSSSVLPSATVRTAPGTAPGSGSPRRSEGNRTLPTHATVAGYVGVTALATFLVRVAQPVGTSVFNLQLCFFPQYLALFAIGLLAYRADWLRRIPRAFGLFWFRLAVGLGPFLWVGFGVAGRFWTGDLERITGGWHLPSALYCLWESFFCAGMCLGLVVLLRDGGNRHTRLTRWLSENSFAVYLFHPLILLWLTIAFAGLAWPPVLKFLLLSLVCLAVAFPASHYVFRRLPGLRRIL